MRRPLLLACAVLVLALLAGCARASFLVANLPALSAQRLGDLPYGEGPRARLDLYPAAGSTPATGPPRPLVVFFYGGGFTDGRKEDYRFVGAALAATGHVVVIPDYRLYPAVRFPEFLADAARAVVEAQRLAPAHGADGRRVVLAGHSAGAYIAAMLAFEPQYLRAAGGDPTSIVALVGLSGPYDIDPDTAVLNAIFRATGTADDYRPLRHVRRGAPPSLLLHGADDARVAVRHSERLAAALRDVGTPVQLAIYPGRGHADTVASLSLPARGRTASYAAISALLASLDALPAALPP